MTAAMWMITASAASAAAAAIAVPAAAAEIVLGMVAPLLAVAATGVLAERTFLADPAMLLPVMLKALAAKALFFAAWVVMMIEGIGLRPEPFVISFVVYFVVLYGIQAALLQRLFGRAWHGAR